MQYIRLDAQLHEVMFKIYNNKHLLNLYRIIREQHMFCSNKIGLAYNEDALHEHELLVDAIETGDLTKALQVLNTHIENAKLRMKEWYINVLE